MSIEIEWKFKKDLKDLNADGEFWYDITLGGYIKPDNLLMDSQQIDELNAAIEIVKSFESAYIELAEQLQEEDEE